MIVSKAFKLRLYPTDAQRAMINNNIGACRFLYNTMLRERLDAYESLKDDKQAIWEYKYKTEKQYKEEYEWMKEVDSTSLQQSHNDLTRAYANFFRSLQNKKGDSGFPKFHKKGVKDSYRVMNNNCSIKMDFDNRKIRMPKMGGLNLEMIGFSTSLLFLPLPFLNQARISITLLSYAVLRFLTSKRLSILTI